MSTRPPAQREDVEKAHEIQVRAGILGGARATALGLGLACIAHYSWPVFRRQPLAFKGFLVSACAISGLVFEAEKALVAHEAETRYKENLIRKQARYDLARQGIVPTETEIAKWKEQQRLATEENI